MSIIIMDNCSIHRTQDVVHAAAVADLGIEKGGFQP